jgi:dsRNA-specific ribonuclease
MTFPAFRCSMKWIRDRSLSTRALNLELPKYLILRRDEMRDDLRGVKLINLGVAFGLNEFPNLRKHTPEVFGYGFRRGIQLAKLC